MLKNIANKFYGLLMIDKFIIANFLIMSKVLTDQKVIKDLLQTEKSANYHGPKSDCLI